MTNSAVVQNFLDLVQIDSPSGEESQVAQFLTTRLTNLGFSVRQDSSGNLFASFIKNGPPVLVNAHMDTVEPGRGVKPQIRDGVIYSDGTTILGADNKIAVAAILTALESTPKSSWRSFELIFSTREETSGGISGFDFSQLQSRTGLVADRASDLGSIVLASPWIFNLHINIYGQTAHASLPEQAVNAISAAAAAISQTKWGRIDSKTTTNIGLITGGSAVNSIPGQVSLVGEIRSFSETKLHATNARINSVFTQVCDKFGARLEYLPALYCPGYTYTKSSPGVKAVIKLFNSLNISPRFEIAFGASDANVISSHQIQLVNISDGGKFAHTVQESVSISSLEKVTEIFSKYITQA